MVSRNDNDALTISFEQPVRDSHQEFRCLSVLPREFVGEVWRTSLCTVDKVAANDANRRLRNRRVVAWVTLHHISDKGFEKRRVAVRWSNRDAGPRYEESRISCGTFTTIAAV